MFFGAGRKLSLQGTRMAPHPAKGGHWAPAGVEGSRRGVRGTEGQAGCPASSFCCLWRSGESAGVSLSPVFLACHPKLGGLEPAAPSGPRTPPSPAQGSQSPLRPAGPSQRKLFSSAPFWKQLSLQIWAMVKLWLYLFLLKPVYLGIGSLVRVVTGGQPDQKGYLDSVTPAFSEPSSQRYPLADQTPTPSYGRWRSKRFN